jgi:hypothetical protein
MSNLLEANVKNDADRTILSLRRKETTNEIAASQ